MDKGDKLVRSIAVIPMGRPYQYLLVGWLRYVGTLVAVIGLGGLEFG